MPKKPRNRDAIADEMESDGNGNERFISLKDLQNTTWNYVV